MLKKELEAENARLRQHIKTLKTPSAIRITADGVQTLTPRKAAMLAARAEAKASGRVVTVVVSTKRH